MKNTPFADGGKPVRYDFYSLADAFGKIFLSISELDLTDGFVYVIKSTLNKEMEGQRKPWDDMLKQYSETCVTVEDRALLLEGLSTKALARMLDSGLSEKTLEFRCVWESLSQWVEMSAMVITPEERRILITTRNVEEQHLFKSIVDKFVYRNNDFFLLLDTKQNFYTLYSGHSNDTPLPPMSSSNYIEAMKEYHLAYVDSDDIDRINQAMEIPVILDKLADQEDYCITFGMYEKEAYRRKRREFTYYDHATGLVLITQTDVTEIFVEEKVRNEQLYLALREAQTDSLTGLYNQKAVYNLVEHALKRQADKPAAIMFVDVDNFKQVNDTLGHMKGDVLLRFVASSLESLSKNSDIIGRVGGDEFLLYLPSANTQETVERFAKRICRIFQNMEESDIKGIHVSCSVGIAMYPEDGKNYQTLVQRADSALYQSKRWGKNTFSFYREGCEDREDANNTNS